MALIKCPECGATVSDSAVSCPQCGFGISTAVNDVIRIQIDPYPQGGQSYITIKNLGTGAVIASGSSGSVITIRSKKALSIGFYGMTNTPMCIANITPQNGGKYRASWGAGFFAPKITSCVPVDMLF